MAYRLVESSSDIVVEADAKDLGAALVYVAQGFSHIVTAGSPITPATRKPIKVRVEGELAALVVAFVQELIFLFDTEQFLPASGTIEVVSGRGFHEAAGTLAGATFDRALHASGTEVKAATLHDAVLRIEGEAARARVLLDL